ncbi:MAG: Hsp70 family protein, partial [Chloroflexi bacterium]|nr:Hsp70 family protein [Chloroflexota bacterium]
LKQAAENAKISLSRDDTADIWVDNLSSDSKAGLEFEYKLTRAELMPLMDPIITRSVNICRQVLQEQRLTPRDISRILLVGGPTLSPYLRERLSDAESGLGIPLEFSIDPMTVVARGAAIYAGSQPLVSAQVFAPPAGAFAITFPNWRFSGSDEEVLTAGNVQSPNSASLAGYTVTVTNSASRPAWQSGRVPVADSGGFMLELFADKSTLNTYTVELSDNLGRRMQSATNPPVLTYRYQRNEIMAPPLTHTVGIELADGSMEILVRKGAPLPAHIRSKFRTIVDLLPDGDQPLKIPLREGGQPRADCNDPIGVLKIEPGQVHRAVPAGTELDITIDIDLSRLVTCKAYIALLDEEFTKVMDLSAIPLPSPAKMQQEFNAQRERLDALREQAQETDDLRAKGILDQIEREKMLYEIETSLAASVNDPDAADKCEERIRDLKAALNAAEDSLRLPNAMNHADAVANLADQIINDFGDDADRKNVEQLKVQVQEAKRAHDVALLEQRNGELRDYCLRLLNKGGVLQILWFQQLKQERAKMSDQHQAEVYFAMGERALANKDVDGLKAVNRQLIDMLPDPPPPPDISTIMKA